MEDNHKLWQIGSRHRTKYRLNCPDTGFQQSFLGQRSMEIRKLFLTSLHFYNSLRGRNQRSLCFDYGQVASFLALSPYVPH